MVVFLLWIVTVDEKKQQKLMMLCLFTNQVSNLNLDVDSDEFVEPTNLLDQKKANLKKMILLF